MLLFKATGSGNVAPVVQLEAEYLSKVHTRLKKKAENHMTTLQHVSHQQQEMRRQATLAPDSRTAVRRSSVGRLHAWLGRALDVRHEGVPWDALRHSPRSPRAHPGPEASAPLFDSDRALQAGIESLVRCRRPLRARQPAILAIQALAEQATAQFCAA